MLRFNRVFFKVLLLFCFSCLLFLVVISLVIGRVTTSYTMSWRELMYIHTFEAAAKTFHHSGNESQLTHWVNYLNKEKKREMYLVFNSGEIIGPTPAPKHIKAIAKEIFNSSPPNKLIKINNYLISQLSPLSSNNSYRLIIGPNHNLDYDMSSFVLRLQVMLAVVLSGIFCYLLALMLTKPLIKSKETIATIANGNLSARIEDKYLERNDELSEVGKGINKMAAKIEALFKSKDRLLEDISHELRSPLARQQVALEILRPKVETILLKHIDRIELENIKLNDLIQEILLTASLNHPEKKLVRETFDLSLMIENIKSDANFEEKNECVFNKCLSKIMMRADPKLLARAIENIVRNGIRYTKENKKIEIEAYQSDSAITIIISDNGPGVPAKELPQIFDAFYRSNRSRQFSRDGYGLGLAIAKQAIELHKGTLLARNRDRGGLELKITIPQL